MSVVFINNSMETFTPTQSGALATHIWECCRAAQRQNVETTVISIRCEAEPYAGVKTILIDTPRIPENRFAIKLLRAERRLTGWRHLRQKKHALNVARALRDAGLHEHHLILQNDPEMAVFLRERFPRAFILHHFQNQLDMAPQFRRRFARSVNKITGVSNFTSRWIEGAYGLARNSVQTIYNAVDAECFTPSTIRKNGLPVINFVGRTGIEKGPDLLLKAALKLAQKTNAFRVQILGSNHWQKFELDDYQRQLYQLAKELENAGVEVCRPGHVGRTALPGALRKADINVVPSRWDEPFALTILEGMACGLASVVARTGGAPEVIGDAGLLFERDSVDGLAGHLGSLLSNDGLRAEYARKALVRAREFTWDRTWSQFREAVEL